MSHLAVFSYELLLNTICNALTMALRIVNKQKTNERYSQMMSLQCGQHKQFYSLRCLLLQYFCSSPIAAFRKSGKATIDFVISVCPSQCHSACNDSQPIGPCNNDAGLLVRSQYPEGPATGHLDTGFSRFPCVYKQMLRRFPTFQVATTCFSCSPPDLNLLVTNFIFCIHIK